MSDLIGPGALFAYSPARTTLVRRGIASRRVSRHTATVATAPLCFTDAGRTVR